MNFQYNREDDVLIIELTREKIDYAEQTGDIIVHFSSKRKAVLLEILDASQFLQKAVKSIPAKIRSRFFPQISIAASSKR